MLSGFSCVKLRTVVHQAPESMGFSRQEYWSRLPCPPPGNLSTQGSNPHLLRLLHWCFTTSATWEAHIRASCCCCQVALVVSDSVRPHRWQPTRLPRPWDSPGKNTGMGCHFLLQCMKVKSESEVTQLCLTLSDPRDCSLPGSFVHGIFQARVLVWGAIAFSGWYI